MTMTALATLALSVHCSLCSHFAASNQSLAQATSVDLNPVVVNPVLANPVVVNPVLANPVVVNPVVVNPAITTPAVVNPAIATPAVVNAVVVHGIQYATVPTADMVYLAADEQAREWYVVTRGLFVGVFKYS